MPRAWLLGRLHAPSFRSAKASSAWLSAHVLVWPGIQQATDSATLQHDWICGPECLYHFAVQRSLLRFQMSVGAQAAVHGGKQDFTIAFEMTWECGNVNFGETDRLTVHGISLAKSCVDHALVIALPIDVPGVHKWAPLARRVHKGLVFAAFCDTVSQPSRTGMGCRRVSALRCAVGTLHGGVDTVAENC